MIPRVSQPRLAAAFTTARITALRPGQSPPPVTMPIVLLKARPPPSAYLANPPTRLLRLGCFGVLYVPRLDAVFDPERRGRRVIEPAPGQRLVDGDDALVHVRCGLRVVQLGREERPFGVEHLEVARHTVVVAHPRKP